MPSANYMHYGKGKVWIVIQPCFTKEFERVLSEELQLSEEETICQLRGKNLYVPTSFLEDKLPPNSYIQFEQKAGQMVICEYLFVNNLSNHLLPNY